MVLRAFIRAGDAETEAQSLTKILRAASLQIQTLPEQLCRSAKD